MGRPLREVGNAGAWKRLARLRDDVRRRQRAEDELGALGAGESVIDADQVAFDNAASGLTADNVQDAIDEVEGRVDAVEDADGVAYDNTSSGLAATDVQAAIDELDGSIDDLVAATSAWSTSNDTAVRSVDADDAAGSISGTPTQAEVENIRDAVLTLSDAFCTLVVDLQAKDIISS